MEKTPDGERNRSRGRFFISRLYKSQLPVIEQALETAALMLGTDKSRGYCLEMICADFLAGASLEGRRWRIRCSWHSLGSSTLFPWRRDCNCWTW